MRRKDLSVYSFVLLALLLISISPYWVGPGLYGIVPIHIWIIANLGIHPAIVGVIFGVVCWLSLGIFSHQITFNILLFWNFLTTAMGTWWLINSYQSITAFSSDAFFVWCSIAFIGIQSLCWTLSLKFKNTTRSGRLALATLLTVNVCWAMMPYYGIY
ncbi:hypothetical protein [Bdellovibrio bacteriovorus]|uniref:hypothetical protein n=1 Tax=Bdellovibrio TaxID=958 RepID=UPI0035A842B7